MVRQVRWAIVSFALVWHLLAVLAPAWVQATKESHARDFASYYYAVVVAEDGGDPYDKVALARAARDDETRKGVYPYFYPPPFLPFMGWVRLFSLETAYRAWFWLDELALLGAAAALALWWRRLSPWVLPVTAAAVGLLSCIPNNHLMGQANLPVLLLVVLGLWLSEQRGPAATVAGGVLVGVAAMLKMSPALFVAWWLLRREWTAVLGALAGAALASVLALGWLGPLDQWRFYSEILPTFASGDYNGLALPADLFGNHSTANFWHELFGGGKSLSGSARVLAAATTLASVGAMAVLFWRPAEEPMQRWAQIAAVAAALLPVPVFTYEHHLVWLLPTAVVVTVALAEERLSLAWAVPIGFAWAAWCFDLADLKQLWAHLEQGGAHLGAAVVRESKFAAIAVFWAAAVQVGRMPRA